MVDMRHFQEPIGGTTAPAKVADDRRRRGFNIMNNANNHAFDGAVPGMDSTNEVLDKIGIFHSGTGVISMKPVLQFLLNPLGDPFNLVSEARVHSAALCTSGNVVDNG